MPRKSKHPCAYPGCPLLTDGSYCKEHQKVMNRQYEKYGRPKVEKRQYGCRGMKLRAAYISQHPLCEQCLKEGRVTRAEEVHHIVPLSHGGKHEFSNLMALCKSCHSRITATMGDRWGHK